ICLKRLGLVGWEAEVESKLHRYSNYKTSTTLPNREANTQTIHPGNIQRSRLRPNIQKPTNLLPTGSW
ncbi:MAG: hypothetical protein ACPLYF_05260, partial [Fervidobacterium sp.]